jgi:hypothetical protein
VPSTAAADYEVSVGELGYIHYQEPTRFRLWRGRPDGKARLPRRSPAEAGTKTRAVKGHEFELDLREDERMALIAFSQTL